MNTNTTHNPKTGLFEFDGKLFADFQAVRHYQEATGTPTTAPNNGKITASQNPSITLTTPKTPRSGTNNKG